MRHEDTGYDELLMSGIRRQEARDRVQPAVDRILAAWSQPRDNEAERVVSAW